MENKKITKTESGYTWLNTVLFLTHTQTTTLTLTLYNFKLLVCAMEMNEFMANEKFIPRRELKKNEKSDSIHYVYEHNIKRLRIHNHSSQYI